MLRQPHVPTGQAEKERIIYNIDNGIHEEIEKRIFDEQVQEDGFEQPPLVNATIVSGNFVEEVGCLL